MKQILKLGDKVRINRAFLGSPAGTLGFIYELYGDFDDKTKTGVSILLEDGKDLGGFSFQDQQEFLEYVDEGLGYYKFESVLKLREQFKKGEFNAVFQNKQ
jgi:hypothetical protein